MRTARCARSHTGASIPGEPGRPQVLHERLVGAREAEAPLRIADDLEVGYGGFYQCTP